MLRQFHSAFFNLLVGSSLLALFLGESFDALMILTFIAINTLLGFYQEYCSERSLALLKQYAEPKARVRRDGHILTVNASRTVPGDVMLLTAGDRVAADVRLLTSHNLTVDESALTGESVPVVKTSVPPVRRPTQIYQAQNLIFAGTTAQTGLARAVAIATGSATMFGRVTALVGRTTHVSSFETNINKFCLFILKLTLATLILLFALNLLIKGRQTNIGELVIFSIVLTVGVVPEALPVVTTFSLTAGALKLAKNKVIVKRLSAIEDLGNIEILCTDKTGTLTRNQLTVEKTLPLKSPALSAYSGLTTGLFAAEHAESDPFDRALWQSLSDQEKDRLREYRILDVLPFAPQTRWNAILVRSAKNTELVVRGAYEVLLGLSKFTGDEKSRLVNWASQAGRDGHRVLAIAKKHLQDSRTRLQQSDIKNLEFVGLVSFADPIKTTAYAAVAEAKKLGIALKILTGDSQEVAGSVAQKIGLITSPAEVVTGEELDLMSNEQLRLVTGQKAVFARTTPEQKYKIIGILKEKHTVGFLGEGINDAPALKLAHVAIAVDSAADISREAADIVLLKKSLRVIVSGIRDGREVFANTTKYIRATLASNFGNFYAVAIASLFLNYLPLLPLQILLVNLLSDFPLVAVATDNVDSSELSKPGSYKIKEIPCWRQSWVLLALCLTLSSSASFSGCRLPFYKPTGLSAVF